ncbi:MAG: sulfite exporter TauE/SafE family protein [Methylococcaceae bacterium]|nr:sulfite exporter TauE/SafE family protein [Methylococcaceae bacterium]
MFEFAAKTIQENWLITVVVINLVLGMCSGFLAGLFGIGGGLVIVPVLVMLFKAQGLPPNLIMIMAIATSLATIIMTSTSSVLAHHRLGSVLWDKVIRLTPGILIGAMLGATIADNLRTDYLRLIFVLFLLYVGCQMALGTTPKSGTASYSKSLDFFVACAIGLLSSLVGIGGGTLTVPYLAHCRYPMRNAVAISSACGLPIALASTASYVALGIKATHLPDLSLGYVYVPSFLGVGFGSLFTAPIGAKLAHKLPAKQLKSYFSILIFLMAIKLVWF